MSRLANLKAQLDKQAEAKKVVPISEAVEASSRAQPVKPGPGVAPSRVSTKHVGAYLHPDFTKGLMMVRAQTGKTQKELLEDVLNDLFRAHGVMEVNTKRD